MFGRAFRALMRRNIVYRRRFWFLSLLEFIMPMCFVGVLVAIKNAAEGTNFLGGTIGATFPTNLNGFQPLSFQDYVTAMRAERFCEPQRTKGGENKLGVTGIDRYGENWQVPVVKCDARKCREDGDNATNFCEYAILAVTGLNEDGIDRAREFAAYIYDTYPALNTSMPYEHDFVQVFPSSWDIDSYVSSDNYGKSGFPKIAMGVVWTGGNENDFSYQLRQNSTNFNSPMNEGRGGALTTPETGRQFDHFARNDRSCSFDSGGVDQGYLDQSCTGLYLYNGVLTFQRLVGDFVLTKTGAAEAGYAVSTSGVQYVQFPTIEYEDSGFYGTIAEAGPLLVILGLLYPVASMVSYIVREKELRQKELMKMMSVTESDIGWSWFFTFFIFNFVSASLTSLVSGSLYVVSQQLWLWIFWQLSFLSITTFCMAMATISQKTTRACLLSILLFFSGVFLTFPFDYQTRDTTITRAVTLHPTAAFSYGLQEIGWLEDSGVGLQSYTVDTSDYKSGITFNDILGFLIRDIVLWGVICWYLNRIIPTGYGQALPLWFPFTRSYWWPRTSRPSSEEHGVGDTYDDAVPFEPVGDHLKQQAEEGRSIEIHGLSKHFGQNIAVDNLNLSIYSGHITALLGHNGAGKTTTINMLTGSMAATSGYATVAGKDTRTQMTQIRNDIGICLQHDCLFPKLTVREHIQFFSRIKGLYATCTRKEAEEHIDQAIQDVALSDKKHTFAKNLSGGMKRKLSVAMAFCGGSKVVLLDEPTSGMDPFSRRFTWNIIRNYRQDRCIILTTHFMDEADILGDRIAIMAEGQLRCCGSSLFLKKTYGVGYQLTIEKHHFDATGNERHTANAITTGDDGDGFEANGNGELVPTGPLSHAHDRELKDIVLHTVADSSLLNNVGTEMTFQLPMGGSADFPLMFEALDEQVDKGYVDSYGVSITTLDEVFLMVARGETSDKKEFASSSVRKSASGVASTEFGDEEKSSRGRMNLDREGLFLTHLGALLRKRAAFFRRDKKAWICTTILPSVFVLVGFVIYKYVVPDRDLSAATLSLNEFNPDISAVPGPKFPLTFNNQDSTPYRCQPGQCAYQSRETYVSSTNERYFFCGYEGRLEDSNDCTIQLSGVVMDSLDGDNGIVTTGADVGTIRQSSRQLYGTRTNQPASQYGGIWFTHDSASILDDDNATLYSDKVYDECLENTADANYTSEEDCQRLAGIGLLLQYNYTAIHISPFLQALADEALVKTHLATDDFVMEVTIDPLPLTEQEASFAAGEDAFAAWFLVVLSFPFIAGAFATFVVTEKSSGAKHLQTVAGVKPWAYWLSTYLWDVTNFQFPLWLVVIMMYGFDIDVMITTERSVRSGVLLLLILFGPAAAGFTYCISFAFSSPSLANVFIIVTGFLIGMGGPLAVSILILLGENPTDPRPNLVDAARITSWCLRLFPTFNLGKGLFFAINIRLFDFLEGTTVNAWDEEILLYEVIFLAIESVFYLALAVQIDIWSTNPRAMNLWRATVRIITLQFLCVDRKSVEITVAIPDDEDVLAEQDRVLAGEANEELIVISQLTKQYDTGKVAVNNLSLGIPYGECFGLLGTNGAGKTTTMSVLTAEFPPTSGDATLAGFSVSNEPQKTRRRIGYCPQFDAHFENLTGREHVGLYAMIKGIPKEDVKEAVIAKLDEVGLSPSDSDRLSSGYSGGMKRRLSLACATIGQPQIVFLDECSTGVDPVARREIWQIISDMVESGEGGPLEERTSVVLTTHSMDECEALCPRLGIMAHGRLRCLGSAQHLKSKFGQGYQVELKVKLVHDEDQDYVQNLVALGRFKGLESDEATANAEDTMFQLEEAKDALRRLTGDDFLADMVEADNPMGYNVWKNASAGLEPLDALAAFATSELRVRQLEDFVRQSYPDSVLRERQDTKIRYEVPSQGIRISNIFTTIERNKEALCLADYGISQTSLEQVFNMHAAEAERLKQGYID